MRKSMSQRTPISLGALIPPHNSASSQKGNQQAPKPTTLQGVRGGQPRTHGEAARYILAGPSGPSWTGIGFYVGNRQETFGAEIFAIMRTFHHLASKRQKPQDFIIFTDSQAAMTRIGAGLAGLGQDMAVEIIDLESKIYEQSNALTTR